MQLPVWTKKQKILLASLLGAALLCVLITVLAASACGSAQTAWLDEDPAYDDGYAIGDTVQYDDTVDSVQVSNRGAQSAPVPVFTFRADPAHPMPENNMLLQLGAPYAIGGTIYSNLPIESVTVSITCAHGVKGHYPYKKTVTIRDGAGSYDLRSTETDSGMALADLLRFEELLVGVHTLRITASCVGTRPAEVYRCTFFVAGEEWEQITRENFPDSYPEALKFFGSEERFLYRYQWVNGRYIMADPAWEAAYITEIPGYPKGEMWRMHVDAVSYMQKAFDFLETSRLRVHGTNGDTGVIKAIALISEYNGCYVSRFTSSLKSISHHTFGTAVDLNASMQPNKNLAENNDVIDKDVKGHLKYNGILTENGVSYYDFTYDGTYKNDPNGVPETCVNYLLYELGFYRAGFLWAHYYRTTSDAMHFCLSEFVTYSHDDKKHGLRKVFAYAPPVVQTETLSDAPADSAKPSAAPKENRP